MSGKVRLPKPLYELDETYIDGAGRFKYILVKVHMKDNDGSVWKYIVRGTAKAKTHAILFDEVDDELEALEMVGECVGGGKIEYTDDGIEIFGTSEVFGRADHQITAELVRKEYPEHTVIVKDN